MIEIERNNLKKLFTVICVVILFSGLAYSSEALRPPIWMEKTTLASRTKIYNLEERIRHNETYEENLEWEERAAALSNKSVEVIVGRIVISELREGESISTEKLFGCSALIGRGIRKNGEPIYFLAHIVSLESMDVITSIIKTYSLKEIEVYFDTSKANEMSVLRYFNSLQFKFYDIKIVTDFSKSSLRKEYTIGKVMLNTKGFKIGYDNAGFNEQPPFQLWKTQKSKGTILPVCHDDTELNKNI